MHRCLIICGLLLSACGPRPTRAVVVTTPISADLTAPCPGWEGPTPSNEGQWVDAAAAEKRGRVLCNEKLATIAETIERTRQK